MALRPLPLFDDSLTETKVIGPMLIEHFHPAIGYWWTDPLFITSKSRGTKRKYVRRFGGDTGLDPKFRTAGWNPFAGRIRAKNWIRHNWELDEVPF